MWIGKPLYKEVKMNHYSQYKYKDCSPKDTIKRIQDILAQVNIEVDIHHKETLKYFHSVFLRIKGTNLFTNGKGTSYEYALASAYGELMERLQNYALYNIKYDISEEASLYDGFYYAPDEKYFSVGEILEDDRFTKLFLTGYTTHQEKEAFLQKLMELNTVEDSLVSLPFYSCNDEDSQPVYIPSHMMLNFYATNGMCAGNTREEALIQGLSEVYERYVNKELYYNKIVPPTIEKKYLKEQYPKIYDMITEIEKDNTHQIIVKDCSLNGRFPVVGVILIDLVRKKYIWKLGAHPVIQIALERTLTELFQGRELNHMMDMKAFCYLQTYKTDENFDKILISGEGYYPVELFSEKFSYDFNEFKFSHINAVNNKELLDQMMGSAYENGFTVLVRDVSFLGFPAYHIIIPTISHIRALTIKNIQELIDYKEVKHALKNLSQSEEIEINKITDYLKSKFFNNKDSITRLLGLPLDRRIPLNSMKSGLFMACAYYKLGSYEDSFYCMKEFVEFLNSEFPKMDKTYYECARDFIGGMARGHSVDYIKGVLIKFYQEKIIHNVLEDLCQSENIFKHVPTLTCYNCQECSAHTYCYHSPIMDIHKSLKSAYKTYHQSQQQKIS